MAKKRRADINSETINKKIKKKDKRQEDEGQNTMALDTYTPQLPDLVIYQILLLLPTKFAIRASILSKHWERIWSLVPVLDFDEGEEQSLRDSYKFDRRSKFFVFLRKYLKRTEKAKLDLDKFRLRMRYPGGTRIIDKWLNLAVDKNVKELDIILISKGSGTYNLPHAVLNVESITTLNLENVKIKGNICVDTVSLPSLKIMSLKNMQFDESLFFDFINSRCPSIECLSLTSCYSSKFGCIEVSCPTLKFLEVMRCTCMLVRVQAMNLESFRFSGDCYWDSFDLASCTMSLRNLELFSTHCTLRCLFLNLERFPLLENLILYECKALWVWPVEQINIFNPHLKCLVFHECTPVDCVLKATINTPSLHSFVLNTCVPELSTGFMSNFSLTAPNLSEATINFNFATKDLPPLRNFLENFDCSRNISLCVNDAEALILPAEMRRTCSPPLPCLKYLKVAINSTTAVRDISALKDSLRWMAPSLKNLSVKHNSIEILSEEF